METINQDYPPNVAQLSDDLLDIVSGLPAMPQRRALLTLPVGTARSSFFFEAPGQVLAKSREIVSELLPGRVPGKWQLGMPAIYLIPPIANPFCTIQDKAAKFRQSIHNGTGWSTFVEQVPCYFGGKWGVTEE